MENLFWILLTGFCIFFVCRTIYIIHHWGESYGYFGTWGFGDIAESFFAGLIGALFIGLITTGVCYIGKPIDYSSSYNVTLYGLSNSTTSEGQFFLGSGTVEGEQYIYYNAKASNGLLKTYKIRMDRCYFKHNSPSTYLEVKNNYVESRIPWLLSYPWEKSTDYIFYLRKEDMNIRNYYDISKY